MVTENCLHINKAIQSECCGMPDNNEWGTCFECRDFAVFQEVCLDCEETLRDIVYYG